MSVVLKADDDVMMRKDLELCGFNGRHQNKACQALNPRASKSTIGATIAVFIVLALSLNGLELSAQVLDSVQNYKLGADLISIQDEKLGTNATITTKATRCPTKSEAQLKDFKKSQFKEDEKLLGYFNGLCGGSYIEMGALDGLKYSNSHVFNKALGWKGLLVELSPSNYKKLVENRRNEIAVVHAAVCANHQTVHYMTSPGINSAVGGIWEFASPSFRERWWKDATLDALPTIECSPLKDLIVEHVAKETYFDFFSLDIEGGEFMALQSIDFAKVGFGIIVVEANKHTQNLKRLALRSFLENRGYVFMEEYNGSNWFYNSRFEEIYSHLLVHEE
jgi:hypothetical protein